MTALIDVPTYGKGYKIMNAIFDTITNALWRGETVTLKGVGTFSVKTRKATRRGIQHFFNQQRHLPFLKVEATTEEFPPKAYVHFEPDPSILEVLNADTESGD